MTTYKNPISLIPKFEMVTSKENQTFINDCKNHFESLGYQIKILEQHIFLDINTTDSELWSPQLHLQLFQNNDSTKIIGKFGPKPQIWTLFMFFHFVIGTAFFGFLMKAISDYLLKQFSIFSVIMLVTLPILWFILYIAGVYGKEKSRTEMDLLYQEIQKCL